MSDKAVYPTLPDCRPEADTGKWARFVADLDAANTELSELRDALDLAFTALAVARGPHDDACGTDLCGMCLIESAYDKALAALRPDLSDAERDGLLAASEYRQPRDAGGDA